MTTLLDAVVEFYTVATHTDPPTTTVTISWMENKHDHQWAQLALPNGNHTKKLRKGAKIRVAVDCDDLTLPTPFDKANGWPE